MEAQLRDEMNAMTNPTLAPYAKEGEVELRITAKAAGRGQARALIAPVEAELRGPFGAPWSTAWTCKVWRRWLASC